MMGVVILVVFGLVIGVLTFVAWYVILTVAVLGRPPKARWPFW